MSTLSDFMWLPNFFDLEVFILDTLVEVVRSLLFHRVEGRGPSSAIGNLKPSDHGLRQDNCASDWVFGLRLSGFGSDRGPGNHETG
jgi:hypothetical protein